MKLPYDTDLQNPEGLLEWLKELDIEVDIRELEEYPSRPLVFSDYQLEPPKIIIYRYKPLDDWLNLVCQHQTGYYGPWYFLHIVYQLYILFELNGYYEIERKWYHHLFGTLSTMEKRAYRFVRNILGTLHPPQRFDETVEQSFRPGYIP